MTGISAAVVVVEGTLIALLSLLRRLYS